MDLVDYFEKHYLKEAEYIDSREGPRKVGLREYESRLCGLPRR